ncbi:MAG: hypothetical protein IPF64_16310 [Flavobacteriales bacterium]|nr:hypothetical protein [Flavobacteriales bacterium]
MRWLVLGMTRQKLCDGRIHHLLCPNGTLGYNADRLSSSSGSLRERITTKTYRSTSARSIDTITIRGPEGGVRFEDFNSDGFPDLVFSYLGNNRVSDLYLFDVQKESFTEVLGFRQVSDSQPVSGQLGLYYSYRRAGCADANWSSTLFEIRDNLVHELGEIEG